MWGSGGIALPILNLGTRSRFVVSLVPWLLYHQEKRSQNLLNKRLGGPHHQPGWCGGGKNVFPVLGMELWFRGSFSP